MPKSEPVTVECSVKPGRAVDEKKRVRDVVFLFEFAEKQLRDRGRSA